MNWVLALLSAALLILTFPGFSLAGLAAVAVAPLVIAAARQPRPARRFLLGWICGVVYWFGVCYWIQFVLAVHGGTGEGLGWALFMLFCFAKALHMGFFALLAGILVRKWWAVPAVAALWVAIEWTHNYLGFAWLTLGNAGIDMSVPLRLAPYTGVYGLSFVFMLMNTTLALAFLRRGRTEMAWLLALLFIMLLPAMPAAERARESAVLVQPDVSESAEWTREWAEKTQRDVVRLSVEAFRTAVNQRPSLVVWPEVPAPFYYFADPVFRSYVNELARATEAHVLLGVVAQTPDGAPLNSAALISPAGQPISRYDKVNLVPFGEFVPWPFKALVAKISSETGDFAPGTGVVVSPVGPHKIGAFICYESVFPHFVRRFAANGAEALFNLSNDGYFGKSAARMQHLAIVRMRAVENRRWILRATNDGVTATIDPGGRIRGRVPPYVEAATRTGFTYITAQTLYTRWGDWFPILCAVVAAALLALPFGRRFLSRAG